MRPYINRVRWLRCASIEVVGSFSRVKKRALGLSAFGYRLIVFTGGTLVLFFTGNRPHLAKWPGAIYAGMLAKFYLLPRDAKQIRRYFEGQNRGFGERAFVSMWFWLIKSYRPQFLLEIGVYRGQTLALWTGISRQIGLGEVEITGVGPLDDSGDSVSDYLDLDYITDISESFRTLALKPPNLIKGNSQSTEILSVLSQQKWDIIYVDGSHDYLDALSDLAFALENMNRHEGAITVVDDAGFIFGYKPFKNSFGGHPGPARAAKEVMGHLPKVVVGHNVVFFNPSQAE